MFMGLFLIILGFGSMCARLVVLLSLSNMLLTSFYLLLFLTKEVLYLKVVPFPYFQDT